MICRCAVLGLLLPVIALAQDSAATDLVSDLPVHEVRAAVPTSRIAVLMTGDGGWASFDRGLAGRLAAGGISVVGLDARSYLGAAKSPEVVGADFPRLIRHYRGAWGASRVTVIGYSRGADIAPFGINRLPPDVRSLVDDVVLIGLSANANFKFRWQDLLRDVRRPDDIPTRPEVERLAPTPVSCFYGSDDASDICRTFAQSDHFRVLDHGGGHRPPDLGIFVRDILSRDVRP